MITENERLFLQKTLLQNQQQLQYYLVLAVILILLSWGLWGALRKTSTLIVSLLLSVGIWYYPWRYYQKTKALAKDLQTGEKVTIQTSIHSKSISNINRIQPYYYIYTDDETFEVNKALYQKIDLEQDVQITYASTSKTILGIELLK